jgi:hypothetical protein
MQYPRRRPPHSIFIEGFRTPATVQAASLRSAGIRNPQQKRKSGQAFRTSALCQHRKSPFSFDHLIGATEQHRWHFEAECFSSLEVDYEIELLRPLYR